MYSDISEYAFVILIIGVELCDFTMEQKSAQAQPKGGHLSCARALLPRYLLVHMRYA